MSQVSAKLRRIEGGYSHHCPGCEEMHQLPDSWAFNGNIEAPTFDPSFKHQGLRREFVDGKWTGEWVRSADGEPIPYICHYFLRNGVLNFCPDSTHDLRGPVPLPDLPAGWVDD